MGNKGSEVLLNEPHISKKKKKKDFIDMTTFCAC